MTDKQLLELGAAASSDIHDVGNACMFRDQCRAMAARIAELEAALRPFAEFGLPMVRNGPDDDSVWAETPDNTPVFGTGMTFGAFRRAAAALGEGVGG